MMMTLLTFSTDRFLSPTDLCLSLAELFVRASLLSTICGLLALGRGIGLGPTRSRTRVDFSLHRAFRVQTFLSTSGPVLLHALRARSVLCDKRNSSHRSRTFLHSSGRTFPHRVRTYLCCMRTDLIHYRNPQRICIAFRRLFSISRRSLPAVLFVRYDHFTRSVWTSSSSPLTVFILEDSGTILVIRAIRANLSPHKRYRRTFAQRVRTFLV